MDDSEQGAQFFFLTLSSGWRDTALEATIPEWLMPHENTLWFRLCTKVSVGPSHKILPISQEGTFLSIFIEEALRG